MPRIFGIETEYGVTAMAGGRRTLTPDEVSRHLFRKVVSWGRSSNVFLVNGARLYLDVGSHPEYATAECRDLVSLVVQDKAGEAVLRTLVADAGARMREDQVAGTIYLFKNNTDSAGNSYGCHENFLVPRQGDLLALTETLLPFLVSRQLICGAGKVVASAKGADFALSQRAEHVWEGVSSATTRSRPIINTRDEPHADAEQYRRLHVIVGDSNLAEPTTLLKVGSADLVLRMIESGVPVRDFSLENPIRAIRTFSQDITGRATVRTANGRLVSALDIQRAYACAARAYLDREGSEDPAHTQVMDLWERTLDAVETGNLSRVAREIDWVIKYQLLERYAARHDVGLHDPRIAQLDLTFHDIDTGRGGFYLLQRAGLVDRITDDETIAAAMTTPPQDTRAKLRGDFVAAAQAHHRDYTVDWVHLRLNDQGQRTILCKDPFVFDDPRVERVIAAMSASPSSGATPPA